MRPRCTSDCAPSTCESTSRCSTPLSRRLRPRTVSSPLFYASLGEASVLLHRETDCSPSELDSSIWALTERSDRVEEQAEDDGSETSSDAASFFSTSTSTPSMTADSSSVSFPSTVATSLLPTDEDHDRHTAALVAACSALQNSIAEPLTSLEALERSLSIDGLREDVSPAQDSLWHFSWSRAQHSTRVACKRKRPSGPGPSLEKSEWSAKTVRPSITFPTLPEHPFARPPSPDRTLSLAKDGVRTTSVRFSVDIVPTSHAMTYWAVGDVNDVTLDGYGREEDVGVTCTGTGSEPVEGNTRGLVWYDSDSDTSDGTASADADSAVFADDEDDQAANVPSWPSRTRRFYC